jgi:hypothetical protein
MTEMTILKARDGVMLRKYVLRDGKGDVVSEHYRVSAVHTPEYWDYDSLKEALDGFDDLVGRSASG